MAYELRFTMDIVSRFDVSSNLYNNGFYIETIELIARPRESCLFRSKIYRRIDQKYINEA